MILFSLGFNFIKCIVQAIIEIKHVINQTFLFSIEDTQEKGINMTANLVFFSVNSIHNQIVNPDLKKTTSPTK